ncbi:PilW family protein [Trinickia diaoshuihuensis]|uniref:PilW family protein n=1 Tax=Trinickia diaoshuihuensis TaxID=2292265 RepID=UPI000E25E459|nr:PilW family protein [Trinickia diaoshuihuensis]
MRARLDGAIRALARAARPRSSRGQRGHLLLEWLIAAAIGLGVLAGALALYRSHRESFDRAADGARMYEAAAAALMLVGQQIQLAGFAPVGEPALKAHVSPGVFGCQSARLVAGNEPDELGCIGDRAVRAGSDEIVVRYIDDAVATWRGASGEATDCLGQGVGRSGAQATIVNRFYVAQPPRRGEPELYCAGNGGGGTPQPIVEGIERMEIRYWLPGASEPVRASTVSLTPVRWAEVLAVDLCVVARGRRIVGAGGFVGCDGQYVSSDDGRARLSLSRRVVVRNQAGTLL